jgi:hypothetical protein
MARMSDQRGSFRKRLFSVAYVALGMVTPLGCKSGPCDPDLADRAVGFMKAHQSCTVDADCVIVGDFCGTLPGGFCGQLTMNREGRDSTEWAGLSKELEDCAPEECTQCLAARGVGCSNGSCNGP